MSYFSRLTDIITCNLSSLLENVDNPQAALEQIIREIEEGLAGARRSVSTAAANAERLRTEIDEQIAEASRWTDRARQDLLSGEEARARQALLRKREVDDLVAALEQQHSAAVTTRDHLTTTLHALEARLADAHRRQADASSLEAAQVQEAGTESTAAHLSANARSTRDEEIEAALAALKRELQG